MELFKGNDVKSSSAIIRKEIAGFSASVKGMDELVHKIACSALTHASLYGDSTLCTECVQMMPKSTRGESLKKWFSKNGALSWVTVGEEQKFRKNDKGIYTLENAYIHPFYEKAETVAKPFDLAALLKMIDGIASRAETGKEKGTLNLDSVSFQRVKAATEKLVADLAPAAVNQGNIVDLILKQSNG